MLKTKKKGNYNIVAIDPSYSPAPLERKHVFGVTFEQGRNDLEISVDTMLQQHCHREQDADRCARSGI